MISRRDSLKWMMAASASGLLADAAFAQVPANLGATGASLAQVSPWPVVKLPPITGPGYGTDPDTMNPTAPWPLTLTSAHRRLINALGDWLLPADDVSKGAGECDIAAFFDEWISAPYPDQQKDRPQLLSLLLWLDAQSRLSGATDFVSLPRADQQHLIEAVLSYGNVPKAAGDAFGWFRVMTIFGYYSMPDNLAAAGMAPENPIIGDYPGPSDEAMAHLNALLTSLQLEPYA